MLSCRPLRPGEGRHWYFDPTLFPTGDALDMEMPLEPADPLNGLDAATRRTVDASPYRSYLEYLISMGGAYGLFRGRHCLGLVAAQPLGSGRTWQLWECLVQPELRRQGLGARLVDKLSESLAKRGVESLICSLSPGHEVGCRFLRNAGFRLVGVETNGAEPMHYYRLNLAARDEAPARRRDEPATSEIAVGEDAANEVFEQVAAEAAVR